jgi:hypothetical protein
MTRKIEIDLDDLFGFDSDEFEPSDRLLELAAEKLAVEFRIAARDHMNMVLMETMTREVAARVKIAMERTHQPTNSFGEPVGEPTSLAAKIDKQIDHFFAGGSTTSALNRRGPVQNLTDLVAEVVRETLATDLKNQVRGIAKQIEAEVRAQVAKAIGVAP